MKKKVLVFLLAVCSFILCGLNTSAARNNVVFYGDLNDDYHVEIEDATLIQRNLVSQNIFSGIQKEAADFDHDRTITVMDVSHIQRMLAKLYIPNNYGGCFDCFSNAKLTYSDYACGKAMVGVPVTFTMQGGYPYGEFEPSSFYMPITYNIEIYDLSLNNEDAHIEPIAMYSGFNNTLTYIFEHAGDYEIICSICDRFENETVNNYIYSVVEPYNVEKPVITSVYTDKPRGDEAFSGNLFVPSCNWSEMTLYVNAVGGCGGYEYSFILIAGEEVLLEKHSNNNSFTINSQYFPGVVEYQKDKKNYNWRDVKSYELRITVVDNHGNSATETINIAAVRDFDLV